MIFDAQFALACLIDEGENTWLALFGSSIRVLLHGVAAADVEHILMTANVTISSC
jgi:hypothetical protein